MPKAWLWGADKPLIGVNHLAGHALTPRLTDQIAFPYLMLLVSGGHCQFLIVSGPDQYHRLGGSIDDAPGEAFDKTARLIGLGQPGGPAIENAALLGDRKRFSFPRPLLDRAGCDMSFSGLKTAVLRSRDALLAEQGGAVPTGSARSERQLSNRGGGCFGGKNHTRFDRIFSRCTAATMLGHGRGCSGE